jgi:hypothetical protein
LRTANYLYSRTICGELLLCKEGSITLKPKGHAMIYEVYGSVLQLLILTSLFWSAAFGAFVLYILNRLNKRQPFSLFSALDIPIKDRPTMAFGDMIISSGIGAGIVLLLLHPISAAEAGTAGLGLTGVLSAFGKDAS